MARHARPSFIERLLSAINPQPVRPSRAMLESHETRNVPPTAKHKVLARPRVRAGYTEASAAPNTATLALATRYVEKMEAAFRTRSYRRAGGLESEAGRRARINRISHYLADAPAEVLRSITYDDPVTLGHLAREEGGPDGEDIKWRGYH